MLLFFKLIFDNFLNNNIYISTLITLKIMKL